MVVYNEGHRIRETLNQLPKVGEVVIVDQESTDNTRCEVLAFAQQKGSPPVKIVGDEHWGFCEPSRKKAHMHAGGDWILVLDADEMVTPEFVEDIPNIQRNFRGARLKRSLHIGGEHRFTGDYQYRFYHRQCVKYLDEIHTEPQPTIHKDQIYSADYISIMHTKSWQEQIRDELAYEEILADQKGLSAQRKRELNVHLALLREHGITPEQADAMSIEERVAIGIGAG
jgi:glycosyltransferase involved in cell wall biosynthesis